MVDIAFYLVTEEIARRSGVIDSRYRTADGRFVLDNKDLSRIRLASEEFINGLSGVEMVSKEQAMILIKENNYAKGLAIYAAPQAEQPEESPMEEQTEEPSVDETTNEVTEETTNEDVGNDEEEIDDTNNGNSSENNEENNLNTEE